MGQRRIIARANGARIVIEVPDAQDAETFYKWIDGHTLVVEAIEEQEWRVLEK